MSEEIFSQDGRDQASQAVSGGVSESTYSRPNYLTVGTGVSEHASKLVSMLEDAQDSGYGGSIADDISSAGWDSGLIDVSGPHSSESPQDRRAVASHVYQLHYNHNRTALGRAISRTMDTMRRLQEVNRDWPAHYPSVQPPTPISPAKAHEARPNLQHAQSAFDAHLDRLTHHKRPSLASRRADTSAVPGASASEAESSTLAARKPATEPRLITPQLARDFSVLKIDLKMDGIPQTEIIHTLKRDSKALAQLLDGQINKSLRHLALLRERIEDTSSKVLVTGDLNAGKSTFVNALLRRKVLPEDEQPCTSIFCEVLDVRENGGIEEVHAIPNGVKYDRNDERTYDVYSLKKLDQIVGDNDRYAQCKVYVKDIRSVDESLLNNGVLDIALIDAPGLNSDSIKTTAVFARQEEIDVVVFVVSAANHFTLSARDFIFDAAREKSYMFMVVNGFDSIKNKQRCQEQILKQVAGLSPATFKESSELVHFVASADVPVASFGGVGNDLGGGLPGGNGKGKTAGGSPGGDDGDDTDSNPEDAAEDSPKDKAKEKESMQDFEALETSLRRFILEKRARSKLAPAKTYLVNVLEDLVSLATVNRDVAQGELDRVSKELQKLEPELDGSKKARTQASDDLDRMTEDAAASVYAFTRETLNNTIADVSQRDLGVAYEGFWNAHQYAQDITAAMLQEIADTVGSCEDYARGKTGEGVNSVKSLGLLHLGDAYIDLNFHSEKMLRRKKDVLARQVDIEVDVWDFFDLTALWDRQQEKVVNTQMALTLATGVVGTRLVGGVHWVDSVLGVAKIMGLGNIRRLMIPGIIAAIAVGVSYAVASIPQSVPRRLAQKLSLQLGSLDFTHSNALRISSEVRKALKIPSDNLRIGLQRNFEELQNKREETNKIRIESDVARKYFGNLVRDAGDIRRAIDRVDLEGPWVAHHHQQQGGDAGETSASL